METIPKADCEKIGFFKKTHGVNGDLVLEFDSQFESTIEHSDCFFVELDGLLVPFFISEEGFRFKSDNTAILTFDGVESEKYARRLVGAAVFLFKNEIVEIDTEFDGRLEGFLLIDSERGELGKIEYIDDYAGNVVLTVNYRGQELLVPFNENFLVNINEEHQTITLNLPEGLIE
jgi:16S rRNA processing protein RimM